MRALGVEVDTRGQIVECEVLCVIPDTLPACPPLAVVFKNDRNWRVLTVKAAHCKEHLVLETQGRFCRLTGKPLLDQKPKKTGNDNGVLSS